MSIDIEMEFLDEIKMEEICKNYQKLRKIVKIKMAVELNLDCKVLTT